MRPALASIFSLAIFSYAGMAQAPQTAKPDSQSDEIRRLESVTWDLKSHTLSWTVQKGTEVKGEFVPNSAMHYEITPDVATMKVAEEKRGFEPEEAALLHRLLDTISIYCAQSVVWWDHGEGARLDDDPDHATEPPVTAKPAPPEKKPAVKPSPVHVKRLPVGVAEVAAHPLAEER